MDLADHYRWGDGSHRNDDAADWETLVSLLAAAALGSMIGFERERLARNLN
jgi:hypothetical protein